MLAKRPNARWLVITLMIGLLIVLSFFIYSAVNSSNADYTGPRGTAVMTEAVGIISTLTVTPTVSGSPSPTPTP